MRDDARAVSADAVIARVLVVVRERVEAGEALESARPAGYQVVPAVVGDGDPGVAEAVGGGGVRAAVADGHGKRRLGASGERDRRLEHAPVWRAAAGSGRHHVHVDADRVGVCALVSDDDAAAIGHDFAGQEAHVFRHAADAGEPGVMASWAWRRRRRGCCGQPTWGR